MRERSEYYAYGVLSDLTVHVGELTMYVHPFVFVYGDLLTLAL